MTNQQSVGIIGYGEVGRSLGRAFVAAGVPVIAFDAVWPTGMTEPDPGVTAAPDNRQIAESCRVIFVCTAASAIEKVAAQIAGHLSDDALVVDLASATAESKIRARDLLGAQADAYLDIALSSPPLHDGLAARMYASGPRSVQLTEWANEHGMDIRYLGERVGQATQLKILRATLTKGLEAILLESLSTALLYDVDPETVLRTVESAFDDRPFQRFCEYLVSTGVVHDHRRAIEIGEAAQMAEAVGIPADMARAGQRVLERAAALHGRDDLQDFRSALTTYARAAGPATAAANPELAVGTLRAPQPSRTTERPAPHGPKEKENMERLDGQVAFITGAARGQGRAEAVKLAELGADIIAVDLCQQLPTIPYPMAQPDDLAETVRLVEATGRRILASQADIRDLTQVTEVLDAGVAELGRLDVVVANAGVWSTAHAVDMPLEMYHDVIDTLLHGAYYTCRAAIPHLIGGGRGGSIIITSSTSSTRGAPRQVAYNIAKAGLTGLMVSLANELAEHLIRVNTVNPSATLTPMIDNNAVAQAFAPDAVNPTIQEFGDLFTTLNLLPVPWCQPEDIANAVAWLASSDSRFVTGIQLPVDAGYLARF